MSEEREKPVEESASSYNTYRPSLVDPFPRFPLLSLHGIQATNFPGPPPPYEEAAFNFPQPALPSPIPSIDDHQAQPSTRSSVSYAASTRTSLSYAPSSRTSFSHASFQESSSSYPDTNAAAGASDPSSSGSAQLVPASPFEGLSLQTSSDEQEQRRSVLESLTLPTLERRSSNQGEPGSLRGSERSSFVDSLPPSARRSFSEVPDISRSTSIMEVVSFLPSVVQPGVESLNLSLSGFGLGDGGSSSITPKKPSLRGSFVAGSVEAEPEGEVVELASGPPSPAERRSIIDGIPSPRTALLRAGSFSADHGSASKFPDNRKSSLFAFDRFYSIDEENARPPRGSHDGHGGNQTMKLYKPPLVIGAKRDVHLLSTAQLVAITCFAVAGGPFGFEDTILAGGAALTLLGLFIFPVFWSAPIALMTAELSCMIPESGGHVLWVYRAFGPFWSFINSFFAFTCSVLDNALYPALFVEYLGVVFSHPVSYGWAVAFKVFVVAVAAGINIRGVDIVGTSAIVLGVGVLAPFAIMCLLGVFHLNFSWTSSENIPASINWGKFITVLLWNTSGFDAAGTCAAEVRNPAQSYPKALGVSVGLILGVYCLPSLIGASVIPNYQQWTKGTYIIAAKKIGGQFLNVLIGISATLSALGLLLTRLCTNSRIIYGMALVDQLPPVFTKIHPKYATPWTAITLTSVITLFLSGFSSFSLSEADMLFYALSTMLKFAALVQLRFTEPDAFRAYKIPLETWQITALASIPITLCITMIFMSSERAHGIALIWSTCAILAYICKELATQHGIHPDEVVQQRMQRVQQNINQMQKRIDNIIDKEVKPSMETIGHALHIHNSNFIGQARTQSLENEDGGRQVKFQDGSQTFGENSLDLPRSVIGETNILSTPRQTRQKCRFASSSSS